jgi:uncharacterized protein DUF6010
MSITMILQISLGIVFGAALVLIARSRGPRGESTVLASGLVATALLYVAFAVLGGASLRWSALEFMGVLAFGTLAWLGVRRSPPWLALGWATHVGWDVGLHLGAGAPPFVPAFFPTFCIGFDLVVAAYVLSRVHARRASGAQAA